MLFKADEGNSFKFIPENERDVFDLGALSKKFVRYNTEFIGETGKENACKLQSLSISSDELTFVLLGRSPKAM